MAMTFEALCELANFDLQESQASNQTTEESNSNSEQEPQEQVQVTTLPELSHTLAPPAEVAGLTYRIEINLPVSRDKAVYDALFRSLREHLR